MLILNRNLNNGKGLWVPPGGHFDLGVEDPADCEALRYIPHAMPKYSIADQALVPVRDCDASAEAAETAVYAAIERWQRSTSGTAPGVRDTVSRDVAQRLHLVSVKYVEYLARQA